MWWITEGLGPKSASVVSALFPANDTPLKMTLEHFKAFCQPTCNSCSLAPPVGPEGETERDQSCAVYRILQMNLLLPFTLHEAVENIYEMWMRWHVKRYLKQTQGWTRKKVWDANDETVLFWNLLEVSPWVENLLLTWLLLNFISFLSLFLEKHF